MSADLIVADASPLIALHQIGRLDLVRQLFGSVAVPPAVVREIAPSVIRPAWIIERPLTRTISPRIVAASLGPGESEAISLAHEASALGSCSTTVQPAALPKAWVCLSSAR